MTCAAAETYKLLIVDASSMRTLVELGEAGPRLPLVNIPAGHRPAQFFTEHIRRSYGLVAVLLTTLPSDAENVLPLAVFELFSEKAIAQRSGWFVSTTDVSSQLSHEQACALQTVLEGKASELGRFARPGWLGELIRLLGCVWDDDAPVIDLRHVNSGINFCLLEIEFAEGRRLWFKAVGAPNEQEHATTLYLAQHYPGFLPKCLLAVPEWIGWASEHVEGESLDEIFSVERCARALDALAGLQQAAIGKCETLLAVGAKDWRVSRLLRLCEAFFYQAQLMMQSQKSTRSRPLSRSELDELQLRIREILKSTADSLPDTLLHGDLGHGNILISSRGPIFLDWAEASVGHPFLCMEHLLASIKRAHSIDRQQESELRQHYASQWKGGWGSADLASFSGLAAFVYAISLWEASSALPDPKRIWPMIRSVLRTTRIELDSRCHSTATA